MPEKCSPQRSGAIWLTLGLQSPEYTGTLTLERARLTLVKRNLQEKELGVRDGRPLGPGPTNRKKSHNCGKFLKVHPHYLNS